MNEEEIQDAMSYNLEYMEAISCEEIFGGDYTSAVDLKYANNEIEKLQQENQQLKLKVGELTNVWNEQMQETISYLEEQLQRRDKIIEKVTNWLVNYKNERCQSDEVIDDLSQISEILKGESDE